MDRKTWAIGLFILSAANWFFPRWNGYFFEPSDVSTGEGRIISVICLVGGLLLWYRDPSKR